MFSRERHQYKLKRCCVSVKLKESGLTSWSDQPEVVWACPKQSFYAKLLTPKDGGSFVLGSLTNRSHEVNSRSLFFPCFAVVVYVETW